MARNRTLKAVEYGGFILGFEPARTETIAEYLANDWNVSESFSSQDWNLQPREMVYLARQEPRPEIFGAALMMKRGRGGGTKRIKMLFAESVLFEKPISSNEAANGDRLSQFVSTADNLKRYGASPWSELTHLVKTLRPTYADSLERLAQLRVASNRPATADDRDARLSEERDAFGIALDIAGLSRKEILRAASVERLSTANSILELIDAQPIAERSLIERDSAALKIALQSAFQNAKLKDGRGREIRAYVLDSTPLETATGVDLLLYQEQFGSFLLLQYKAMERNDVVHGWSYRVDGTNLLSQLKTMNHIRSMLPFESPRLLEHQRLSDEPFYFKFCERRLPTAGDDSLVAGITMSAPHLDHFLTLPEARVEGHGRRVGYENCPRYLNNSEFVALARAGWIGCQGATTAAVAEIVHAREEGRIAIVAVIKGLELKAANRARQP